MHVLDEHPDRRQVLVALLELAHFGDVAGEPESLDRGLGVERIGLPAGRLGHVVLEQSMKEVDVRAYQLVMSIELLHGELPVVDEEFQVERADSSACLAGAGGIAD